MRLPPDLRDAVDDWANAQSDRPSRSEAIRRLVEQALGNPRPGQIGADAATAAAAEKGVRPNELNAENDD